MDVYMKLPAVMLKAGKEVWLPCKDDLIPLSVHMTSYKMYQFLDGDWLCGVQIEDKVIQDLMQATSATTVHEALVELTELGIGTYWLGIVGEEELVKEKWPELSGTFELTTEEGTITKPVFQYWGGVYKGGL